MLKMACRLQSACAKMEYLFHSDRDRKSTRLNSSHDQISYAVFCLKKKNIIRRRYALSVFVYPRDSDHVPNRLFATSLGLQSMIVRLDADVCDVHVFARRGLLYRTP